MARGDSEHESDGKSCDDDQCFHGSVGVVAGVQLQDAGSSYSSESSHGSWHTPHMTSWGSPQKCSCTPFSGQVSLMQVTVLIMPPRKSSSFVTGRLQQE